MKDQKAFRVLLVFANKMMENLIPINMSVLSAVLKQHGFEVKLFDTTYYRTEDKSTDETRVDILQLRRFDLSQYGIHYKDTDVHRDFRRIVMEYKPDLVGLCVVEDTCKLGFSLLKSIKDLDVPIIVGGVYAILCPEEVIAEDVVDMVCIGEGEEVMVELCERMKHNRDYITVPGLWIKENGRIIKNPMQKLINLNALPYLDFSIYEEERFYRPMQGKIYRMLPVEMGRGCSFSCTFCCAPALRHLFKSGGSYFRKKTIERVIDEIRFYRDTYGLNYVYFTAETFLSMNEEDFEKFISLYKEIKLPFWCQTRPETISENRIKALEEICCNRISVGLESGNEVVRKRVLNRVMSNEEILKAFEILARSTISVSVNNIIGIPDETREQVFDTINLNRSIKSDSLTVSIFTPYKGSALWRYCINKGYISKDDFSADSVKASILTMPSLSKDEIRGLLRTFSLYVKFYKSDYELIKRAERFDEEGNRIFLELSERYRREYFK